MSHGAEGKQKRAELGSDNTAKRETIMWCKEVNSTTVMRVAALAFVLFFSPIEYCLAYDELAGVAYDASDSVLKPTEVDNSLYTGAATYRIPIVAPPGRVGISPTVTLNYSSQTQNGLLGMGWTLDIGSIRRNTLMGLNYTQNDFVYTKDGSSQPLVSYGGTEYRAKIDDGSFMRFFYDPSQPQAGWTAYDKNGVVYTFGAAANGASRQDNSNGVFKWCLDQVQDLNGNYMNIAYTKVVQQGEIYLAEIDYTGNSGVPLLPSNRISFYYESRTDQPPMYATNSLVVTAYRLKTIAVTVNSTLVRAYNLTYAQSPTTGRSLLSSFQQFGDDAVIGTAGTITNLSTASKLPEMDMTYLTDTLSLGPENLWFQWCNGSGQQLGTGDFNGDGKTDIYCHDYTTGYTSVALSNGVGFLPATNWMATPFCKGTGEQFGTGDFDGDGKTDIYCRNTVGNIEVAISTGSAFTYSGIWHNSWCNPPSLLGVGDFNGDLKADIYCHNPNISSNNIHVAISNGINAFVDTNIYSWCNPNGHMRLGLADFNGDGKADMVCHDPDSGNSWVALSTGAGGFASSVESFGSWCNVNNNEIFGLGDFNGDGKTDIFCFNPISNTPGFGTMKVALSDGTGVFTPGNTWYTYCTGNNQQIGTGDFNGDGKTDTYCFDPSSGSLYIALSGQQPQHNDLLVSITNGLGATTGISYTLPSLQYASQIPFAVPTVASIAVNDGLGNISVTSYSYDYGYYDSTSREFRGFGHIAKTNPDGTMLETWFHQRNNSTVCDAPDDADLKGKPCRTKLWGGQALLNQTDYTWSKIAPQGGGYPVYARLTGKVSNSSIGGVQVTASEQNVYDNATTNYNNAVGTLTSKTLSGTDAENITTSYAYGNFWDPASKRWVWRKTGETTRGSATLQARATTYDYFNYLDTIGRRGNLKAKKVYLDDANGNPLLQTPYATTSMDYYAAGVLKTITDPLTRVTTFQYDSTTQSFPVEIDYPNTTWVDANNISHTIAHTVQYGYDYGFGVVNSTTDENGNTTSIDFDKFGRAKQKTLMTGTSIAAQTVTVYNDNSYPQSVQSRVLENGTNQYIDKYVYFDGLRRNIQTVTLGEGNNYIVSKMSYDSMGRTALTQGPFFSTAIDYLYQTPAQIPWTQTYYDYFGNPSIIQKADGYYEVVETDIYYSGLSTTVIDPDLSAKTTKKDYLGRPIQITEWHGSLYLDRLFNYGMTGDWPVSMLSATGATVNIGVFRNGAWYVDTNGDDRWEVADGSFTFGTAGDIPVVGDWNGNGKPKIGIFRGGTWYLDYVGDGVWHGCGAPADPNKDACITPFGQAGDFPAVGDWNGNKKTKIGVFRSGSWLLDYVGDGVWHGCGAPADPTKDLCYTFGQTGDLPVVGDWNGDGKPKIGVFRSGSWLLDYVGDGVWHGCGAPADPTKDLCFTFGTAGDIPVVGDWNGDGKTNIGIFRNGTWYLDVNGDGLWNPTGTMPAPSGNDPTTIYKYDAVGNLLTVTDANSNTTTVHYDALGRKTDMQDPDMGLWQYIYDVNGNLKTQTDAKGQIISFGYDELNRLVSKSYSTSDPAVTYTYDNPGPGVANGIGKLYSMTKGQIITTYDGYDAAGRIKSVTEKIDNNGPYITLTNYDLSGKPTQITYPGNDGFSVTYSYYPSTGLLQSVTGSDGKVYSRNSNYEPSGKIGQIIHGDTTTTTYTYDFGSKKLKSIVSSGLNLINRAYQYSKAGDMLNIIDYVNNVQYQYAYDSFHRLNTETTSGTSTPTLSMSYDPIGNIKEKDSATAVRSYTIDPLHAHVLQGVTVNGVYTGNFQYDANGNMHIGYDLINGTGASRTIVYNADNKPTQVTGNGGMLQFEYDGNGGRAKKNLFGGAATYYIGQHYEVINGVPTRYVFAGNMRIAKVSGQNAPYQINYYHGDHLGSAAAMTDASGNVAETTNYQPFGGIRNPHATTVSNYKFTDQELDPESGLYYYGARYYDTEIGRFISPDTIVQNYSDPQTLNRYSYARNNPLIYTDPTGHWYYGDDEGDNNDEPTLTITTVKPTQQAQASQASQEPSISGSFSLITPINNVADQIEPLFIAWMPGYSYSREMWTSVLNKEYSMAGLAFIGMTADVGGLFLGGESLAAKIVNGEAREAIAAVNIPLWTSTETKTSVENAFAHWIDHSAEFPEYQNAKQYVEGAKNFFIDPPSGTLTKGRTNGDNLFYNPSNNTFGVQAVDGAPRTMFRPTDGINYWKKQ